MYLNNSNIFNMDEIETDNSNNINININKDDEFINTYDVKILLNNK